MAEQPNFLDYEGLADFKKQLNGADIVTAGSANGSAYTATVPGVTELKAGMILTIVPARVSTSKSPTLDLNALGAKTIRQRIADRTDGAAEAASSDWMAAGAPVTLQYTGSQWVTMAPRASAGSFYGKLGRESLMPGATYQAFTVTLYADFWLSLQQSVNVQEVTVDSLVWPAPAPSSHDAYVDSGVRCIRQESGSLTFSCLEAPTENITVNVVIFT